MSPTSVAGPDSHPTEIIAEMAIVDPGVHLKPEFSTWRRVNAAVDLFYIINAGVQLRSGPHGGYPLGASSSPS